ncbi:hypothetical protein JW933_00325 [candidate division FCPU426 bacterium]|nr:hypothetical protein [candidate division FCPU426 bacterium]
MSKKAVVGMGGLLLLAGMAMMAGCFTAPTSPLVTTSGGSGGGIDGVDAGGDGDTPTMPDPTGQPRTISGTVANSAGGYIVIYAEPEGGAVSTPYTMRTGDGAFTIIDVPGGTYEVYATEGMQSSNRVNVSISEDGSAEGVNLRF